MSSKIKAVTLIGAGTQGTRLAYMWSRLGRPVHLVDQDEKRLSSAIKDIHRFRLDWSDAHSSPQCGAIVPFPSNQLAKSIADSWMVLECVPESLALKKKLLKELDAISQPDLIVASNSSSYTISEITEGLGLKHPERCVSVHSYWPPETSAVEIMGSSDTKSEILSLLMMECKNHGFEPFQVRGSSTGYIYNRIWAAIKRETLLALSEGIASPLEIDEIFKNILKTPKGPCEQMDVVGLDVVLDIENHYRKLRLPLPNGTIEILEKMKAENKLGVKSGSGFYNYKTDE